MTTNRDRSACSINCTVTRQFQSYNHLIPRHSSSSTAGVPRLAKTAPPSRSARRGTAYLACTGTTSWLKNQDNVPDASPGNVTSLNRRAVMGNNGRNFQQHDSIFWLDYCLIFIYPKVRNMKNFCFILSLFLLTLQGFGQDSKPSSNLVIGIYTSIGVNQPLPLQKAYDELGTFKYYGRGSYSAGIMFTKPITQKLKLSVAAVYSVHKVGFNSNNDPSNPIPMENFEVFNVPITLKTYLRNNFFLNPGIITDFDVPRNAQYIGHQTGFGFSFGAGKDFNIRNFALDISPNIEIHSIIPFQPKETKERLLVFGFRIGLSNYCP